jgi:excisionase family DNA binding protein
VNPGNTRKQSDKRLALSKAEAAEALGVSVDFLERHVIAELRVVRRGRRRLIPVRELERWLEQNAARALDRP